MFLNKIKTQTLITYEQQSKKGKKMEMFLVLAYLGWVISLDLAA